MNGIKTLHDLKDNMLEIFYGLRDEKKEGVFAIAADANGEVVYYKTPRVDGDCFLAGECNWFCKINHYIQVAFFCLFASGK